MVLIWALYILLRPVSRSLALLAVLLRLVEVSIHYVSTSLSLGVLLILSGAGYLEAFNGAQLNALARVVLSAQGAGLNLGFIPLDLGSAVFAYLLFRSNHVPKHLASWGVFSSMLLATSAMAVVLFPAVRPFVLFAMVPMFAYEVSLGIWLLFKGAANQTTSRRRA